MFAVDTVVRLVKSSDCNSTFCCCEFLFFYGMIFATYAVDCCVFAELGDVSKFVAVAALVVGRGVVVVAEFADFVKNDEVVYSECTQGVGAYQ